MLEVSRRNFLKATALSAVCLSGLNASFLEFSQAKQVKYFIKDSEIPHQGNFINADEILLIEKDISNIYSQLKEDFENKALIGSVSSGTTFFVIRTMACVLRMKKNKVIFILGFWHQKELNYDFTKKCFAK
ncbi:TPA: twin-arginine translocation signal domain-containing protein [Campylobacter coli]|nr:twin-arginine translocation signal domain-containing protein [Campylobacter coli]HED7861956.1 twin-arginine translocation signal domain-containing protein [Campylobacter coli]HED7869531.1 twin-arginine translocation signal domain-containing protein [Campylobacter coli]HED7871352.1 twin-arginine translocation signal domain-containing protein [Campylobacter coli]HED7950730.1 twin-arginine translocation signal domain-containing protein [Campylobacter coli]